MAYDATLAGRVRQLLTDRAGFAEKKMFGGICFLLQGNMVCGVLDGTLIVRVGKDQYADALAQPHAREFDITGKAMSGWVMVGAAGQSDEELRQWVERALRFATTLPPKKLK